MTNTETIRPLVDVIQLLINRGSAPSKAVQRSAAHALPLVSRARPAIVYRVPSASTIAETYAVSLYMAPRSHDWSDPKFGDDGDISAASCPCDHHGQINGNGDDRICHHILTALAIAVRDGYRLDI